MSPKPTAIQTSQGLDSTRCRRTTGGSCQVTYIQRVTVDMHSVFGTDRQVSLLTGIISLSNNVPQLATHIQTSFQTL